MSDIVKRLEDFWRQLGCEHGLLLEAMDDIGWLRKKLSAALVEQAEIERLRAIQAEMRENAMTRHDEIERLRERCEAYKGQVLAGSAEIERLRAEVNRLRMILTNHRLRGCIISDALEGNVSSALSNACEQDEGA